MVDKIKFGTDGWRAIIADTYTITNLARVTEASAEWLFQQSDSPSITLGYDCRFNGKLFADTVANIMASKGVKVYLSDAFCSTPMISLATLKQNATAGIIITASHNPPEYSGFKIKGSYGGPAVPAMISEVEEKIPDVPQQYEDKLQSYIESGLVEYIDFEKMYADHIAAVIDLDLIETSGIIIGYDAMYGAGQSIFKKLLPSSKLLHCEFNPSFLGQAPEPIERNLKEFQALIKRKKIDIGLATDGDADRIGLFDENGNFVDSHHILLLLVHYMANGKKHNSKVVHTFSCTSKIKQLCKHYNLQTQVTPIGFKYIAEIMLQEEVMVGGEESGGISAAGHIPERDGIYIGLVIMEMMAKKRKKLTELIQEVYDIVGKFYMGRNDLHLQESKKLAIVEKCKTAPYKKFGDYTVENIETIDGFKFHLGPNKWVMIRPSGTEPVLRIYAEGETKEVVEDILEKTIKTALA